MFSGKEFEEKLAALKLKILKISSNSLARGRHPSKFLGAGEKMKDYGEYDPAIHDVADIDFVLSAGEPDGKLWVKRFFDEKIRPTFILIDTTKSMYFGDKLDTALVLAWISAANLILDGPVFLVDSKDIYSEKYKKFSSSFPKESVIAFRKNYEKEIDFVSKEILGLRREAIQKQKDEKRDFSYADLEALLKQKRKRANLIIISDFITAENFSGIFKRLKSAGFAIFAFVVRDEAEENLPALGPLDGVDPETKIGGQVKSFKDNFWEENFIRSSALAIRITSTDEAITKIRLLLNKAGRLRN